MPDADGLSSLIVRYHLEPGVARQPTRGLGMDDRAALKLAASRLSTEGIESRVHDHRGAVGVLILGDVARRQRDEGVGPADVERVLGRHRRVLVFVDDVAGAIGDAIEGPGDDRPLIGREAALQPETASVVEPPVAKVAGAVGLDDVFERRPALEIGLAANASDGDPARPRDQPPFRFGGREATELDDFIERQGSSLEGRGYKRQIRKGVGRGDPPARGPVRNPKTPRQPLGEIPAPLGAPRLRAVALGYDLQQRRRWAVVTAAWAESSSAHSVDLVRLP